MNPLITRAAAIIAALVATSQLAAQQPEGSKVTVHADDSKNGWDVRVSWDFAPDQFSREGQTWTLERAKELADQIKRESDHLADELKVAKIQIVGKDGDGKVGPQQMPTLPDPVALERQFRAGNGPLSDPIKKLVEETIESYKPYKEAVDAAIQRGETIPTPVQQAIQRYKKKIDEKIDQLDKALLPDQPNPFPRINVPSPNLPPHVMENWLDVKRDQYDAEQQLKSLRQRQQQLSTERDAILSDTKRFIYDREAEIDPESIPERKKALDERTDRYGANVTDLRAEMRPYERQVQAPDDLLALIRGPVVDRSGAVPAIDRFATEPGSLRYSSRPGVLVVKTGPDGQALPDDGQPPGYPKSYDGSNPKSDEKVVVNPQIGIQFKGNNTEIQVGIYGQVTGVDPENNRIEVKIDSRGNTIVYLGVDVSQVTVGDYLTPKRTLSARPSVRELFIRAMNASGQPVNPSLIDDAFTPPVDPKTLDRGTRSVAALPLPIKPSSSSSDPKYIFKKQFDYDRNAPTGLGNGTGLSKFRLEMKESVATTQLKRAQDDENQLTERAALIKQKLATIKDELGKVRAKLKSVGSDSSKVFDEAKRLKETADTDLAKELSELRSEQKRLKELGARLEKGDDTKAKEEFNKEQEEYSKKLDGYRAKEKAQASEAERLLGQIGSMKKEKQSLQKQETELLREQQKLQDELATVQASLDKARDKRVQQSVAVKALGEQRKRLDNANKPNN